MAKDNPKDPRFRPYRALTLGIYLVITVGVCAHLIISVFRSTYAMTFGQKHEGPEQAISFRECVEGLDRLWNEVDGERKKLSEPKVSEADQRWVDFRVAWVKRMRDLEGRCSVESHGREKLKEAFGELQKVMDLYTTNAVQFSGETGPSVDKLRATLQELRKEPSMGRLP